MELSDRYGSRVIAVGVERQRMVENLWLLGVQVMRGYFVWQAHPADRPFWRACGVAANSDLANLAVAINLDPRGLRSNHGRHCLPT